MPATITPEPTARERITAALAAYGITAHADKDAGNSWLVIPVDLTSDTFPGAGTPHLVVYVYDAHDDWTFVDAPIEHAWGAWRVAFHSRHGVEHVLYRGALADPAAETAKCAAFIAKHLAVPSLGAEGRAARPA
ncbi:hypothetical protein [Streptomyces sp. NPDC055140]